MKPLDALFAAFSWGLLTSRNTRGPGKVIEACSKEVREGLTNLTSDELAKVRVDKGWMNDEWSFHALVRKYGGK